MILDQPIRNSVERAIWWIEYVIRNGGTVNNLDISNICSKTLTEIFIFLIETFAKQENKLGKIFDG